MAAEFRYPFAKFAAGRAFDQAAGDALLLEDPLATMGVGLVYLWMGWDLALPFLPEQPKEGGT